MSSRLRLWKLVATGIASLNAVSEVSAISEIGGAQEISYYIVFGTGTTAGAVQIESAHTATYAGVWAAEGSPVAWAAADRVHKLSITGVTPFIRARVSTLVANGTVDIYIAVNG
jgi:hypothetical protein